MRPSKYLIGITAICAAGVLAVACSSGSKSGSNALDTGDYNLQATNVSPDTCFNTTIDNLLDGSGSGGPLLPFHIDVSGNSFTLTPQTSGTLGPVIAAILPPLVGTKTGNNLSLTATGHYFLTSSCSLGFSTNPAATGTMTAKDAFNVSLPLQIAAETTNAAYTTDCTKGMVIFSNLVGGFVPWPALSGAGHTTGNCGLTIAGTVTLQ